MIEGKFDVVFRGQTIKSMDTALVKQNLVSLFRSSPAAIEKLFSGDEVAVRKSLDYGTAMKYQSALKKAGALALIKEIAAPESKPPQQPTSSGKAVFGEATPNSDSSSDSVHSNSNTTSQSSVPTASAVNQQQAEPASIAAEANDEPSEGGSFSLAAAGAQIMPDKVYEKRDVDTSELSLAAAGERIMPKSAPENLPQPNIEHLKLG
jgi:hypothetical protein